MENKRKMRIGKRLAVVGAFAAATVVAIALGASAQQNDGGPQAEQSGIRGFAPARVAAERELEKKLKAVPDPEHAEAEWGS